MNISIPATSTPVELPATTRRKITDVFTRDEIKVLTARSNLMGFAAIGFSWSVIALCFAVMAWASMQPLIIAVPVFVLATIVVAGRQLSLGILQHDAAHGTLFNTKWLNEKFTDWVCARAIWNDLTKYRPYHFIHHTKTATPEDPDLSLVAGLPTSRASIARKFLRDIVGLTGLKFLAGRLLMDLGFIKWTVTNQIVWISQTPRSILMMPVTFLRNATPAILVNGLLFAVLWAVGHPLLYLMWVLAYVTPFPLFTRIRSFAEHAALEKTTDMFLNTRTTRAGFIARATVAPLNVNYHIEHHIMASAPYFRLPKIHRLLRERGAVAEPPGYLEVFRIMSSRPSARKLQSTQNSNDISLEGVKNECN